MNKNLTANEYNFSSLQFSIDSMLLMLKQQIKHVYGEGILTLFDKLSEQSPAFEQHCQDRSEILSSLNLADLKRITHCFSVFFLLSNQAEQTEILRIKRQRQLAETAANPRSESVNEAIFELKKRGLSLERAKQLCSEIKLIPTLTAHPTESRRRSVLKKQLKVADCLLFLAQAQVPERQRETRLSELKSLITSLLLTDDVRATRLSVQDEVENGLFFLASSIVQIVPNLINDFRQAMLKNYQADLPDITPVSYRSWIGGDRDGNPKVTCQTTREALSAHRKEALTYYLSQIKLLRDELSLSTRKIKIPAYIEASCRTDKSLLSLDTESLIDMHQVYEPLREKCETISLKILATLESRLSYKQSEFLQDLLLIRKCLTELKIEDISDNGILSRLLDQVRAFGFYLAQLDLRQHSDQHQQAIDEILGRNKLTEKYSLLSEQQKVTLLSELLESEQHLSTDGVSQQAHETILLFQLVAELEQAQDRGLGSYVISMTHTVSDLLEPIFLWKIANGKNSDFPLDISPLFETIEDLEHCGELLEQIFQNRLYLKHLTARGRFQEIMLGYSDSNKDGGYASANILLYEAQLQISRVCLKHSVAFQIFHGRGGSVGRGGGRAGRAITASPSESNNGRVRLTEQGEVVSFRYSMSEIGHRHLEQIVSAILLATQMNDQSLTENELLSLKRLAKISMLKYRSLVEHPDFWEWYVRITPIKFISSLPIASRPVMRSGTNLEFENLRAIPWVFSWTQTRYNIPSWFGLGTAFSQLIDQQILSIADLQDFYTKRTFFKTLIDNAQQEMARARLEIARQYTDKNDLPLHNIIQTEFSLTEKMILQITRQNKLLDNNPVIQKSIQRRNPFTDPLSLIQIELLSRDRKGKEKEDLTEAIHMTISGLAAAMQTTG